MLFVNKLKSVALIILIGCSPLTLADQQGVVEHILVNSDGWIYFLVSGDRGSKPACASANHWSIKDENSAGGKAQLSLLLAAQVSGKEVIIYSSNECTRYSQGEDAAIVRILP